MATDLQIRNRKAKQNGKHLPGVKELLKTSRPYASVHKVKMGMRMFLQALKDCEKGAMVLYWPDEKLHHVIGDTQAAFAKDADSLPVMFIHDNEVFTHSVLYGEIGFGECYEYGFWSSPDPVSVLTFFIDNSNNTPTFSESVTRNFAVNIFGLVNYIRHLLRPNTVKISRKNIAEHYDLSNDFFELMLDKTMAYSSAYFKHEGESLYQGQLNKFDIICRKLDLQPTDHLLEIGTGWGGLAIYAAEKYGCQVTTTTISSAQHDFAQRRIKELGLEDKITLLKKDYRHLTGNYDKIVSVEMVEALGFQFFDTFFSKCADLLKPDGLMLIQAITFPDPWYNRYRRQSDWIQKHIFPGSLLLSVGEIQNSLNRTGDLMIYDLESIGLDYAKTLRMWQDNVQANVQKIKDLGFDDKFMRRWIYYLCFCEAGFQERYINDLQILFSRPHNNRLKNKF